MHWEPMTLNEKEQAFIQMQSQIVGTGTVKPRETFDYKPGFKWLEFRQGHNAIAMQDARVTQAVIKFILYIQRKQAEAA